MSISGISTRHRLTAAKPAYRARVSNGAFLPAGTDLRSAPARRYRDVIDDLREEIGDGEFLPVGFNLLLRRCATIVVALEAEDARQANGEMIDMDVYARASGLLYRLLRALGCRLQRPPRKSAGSLRDYVVSKQRRAAADVQPEDDEP